MKLRVATPFRCFMASLLPNRKPLEDIINFTTSIATTNYRPQTGQPVHYQKLVFFKPSHKIGLFTSNNSSLIALLNQDRPQTISHVPCSRWPQTACSILIVIELRKQVVIAVCWNVGFVGIIDDVLVQSTIRQQTECNDSSNMKVD